MLSMKGILHRTVDDIKRGIDGALMEGIVLGGKRLPPRRVVYKGDGHLLLVGSSEEAERLLAQTVLTNARTMIIYDATGTLWDKTSGGQKHVGKPQGKWDRDYPFWIEGKSVKIQPFCTDGSAARWNPLLEIRLGTVHEWEDTELIVRDMMIFPSGAKDADTYWQEASIDFVEGLVLHLLYKARKEYEKPPSPKTLVDVLATTDIYSLLREMMGYAHIKEAEFFGCREFLEWEPGADPREFCCPLETAYGEYIHDFKPYEEELGVSSINSLDEMRIAIHARREIEGQVYFDEYGIDDIDSISPWHRLLIHPKVFNAASTMDAMPDVVRECVLHTAKMALHAYQNPIVQKNTETSDFVIDDLKDKSVLDENNAVYFIPTGSTAQNGQVMGKLFMDVFFQKIWGDNGAFDFWHNPLILMNDFPAAGKIQGVSDSLQKKAKMPYQMYLTCRKMEDIKATYGDEAAFLRGFSLIGCFAPDAGSAETVAYIKDGLGIDADTPPRELARILEKRILVREQGKGQRIVLQSDFKGDINLQALMNYPPLVKSDVLQNHITSDYLLQDIFEAASREQKEKTEDETKAKAAVVGQTVQEYLEAGAKRANNLEAKFKREIMEKDREEARARAEKAQEEARGKRVDEIVREKLTSDAPPLMPYARDLMRKNISDMMKVDIREVSNPIEFKKEKIESIKQFLKQEKLD